MERRFLVDSRLSDLVFLFIVLVAAGLGIAEGMVVATFATSHPMTDIGQHPQVLMAGFRAGYPFHYRPPLERISEIGRAHV